MDVRDRLTERFEARRGHLRAVAYRLLGSLSEADDAVQETWLRLCRADTSAIANLGGWLTTVVSRICLNMLQSRKTRREESLGEDLPGVRGAEKSDPEDEALLSESVGLALLVILDTLAPAERVAFVLHDVFAVPFDEIARIVDRSPAAARQLASRARRRIRGAQAPDMDLARQRTIVDAFLAAIRDGDFNALLAVLDPDVLLRADRAAVPAGGPREARGASAVAGGALMSAGRARRARVALVNGAVGIVWAPQGPPRVVLGLTFARGRIVAIDVIADPARLRQLDLAALDG
jgi:RNA polymerase sigma-70 factor (ECF subfamily)